jgi:hypothetical protein
MLRYLSITVAIGAALADMILKRPAILQGRIGSPTDIRRICPGVLIHRAGPRTATFMTKRYLIHLLLSFYDVLNARAVRRKLCEYYASDALYSEAVMACSVAALPRCRTIRGIVVKALHFFLKDVVCDMRRRINIYSGQGIRGDRNYDLATRVGWKSCEGLCSSSVQCGSGVVWHGWVFNEACQSFSVRGLGGFGHRFGGFG